MKDEKNLIQYKNGSKGINPGQTKKNPVSIHVGFVVGKVALGQVFPRVLRFSPVNFIPPVLHYKEKRKN
jgi:hypothetical protein